MFEFVGLSFEEVLDIIIKGGYAYECEYEYDEEGEEYDCDLLWDEIQCMDDDQRAFLTFGNNELCHFLWDNHIGDLHEGNFGYIGSRMVIVDFSGWFN